MTAEAELCRSVRKVGRNEPGPGGSSLKFKRCHGLETSESVGPLSVTYECAPGLPVIQLNGLRDVARSGE
jgi:hypothetical protein